MRIKKIKTDVKISFIIPSWNRLSVLKETIEEINKLKLKHKYEIIVINDCSSEQGYDDIKLYDNVRYFRNETSKERIESANIGFMHAKGEYIVSLDDDSFPGKNSIEKGIEIFETCSNIGCIAMEVYDYNDFKSKKIKISDDLTMVDKHTFIGCGAMFRREVLYLTGMWENLPNYAFEVSFAIRILNLGFRIVQRPDVYVIHKLTNISRPADRRMRTGSSATFRLYWTYNDKFKYTWESLLDLVTSDLLRKNWYGINEFLKLISEGKFKKYKINDSTKSKMKSTIRTIGGEVNVLPSEFIVDSHRPKILLFRTAQVQVMGRCIEELLKEYKHASITVVSHVTQTSVPYNDIIWYKHNDNFKYKNFSEHDINTMKNNYDVMVFMGYNMKYLGGVDNLQSLANKLKLPLYSMTDDGIFYKYTYKDLIKVNSVRVLSYGISAFLYLLKVCFHMFNRKKSYDFNQYREISN